MAFGAGFHAGAVPVLAEVLKLYERLGGPVADNFLAVDLDSLVRANKLRQAVSLCKAVQTATWRGDQASAKAASVEDGDSPPITRRAPSTCLTVFALPLPRALISSCR